MSHQSQNRRQQYLDWLYRQDGRFAKNHPMHGLYTGLFQDRLRDLLRYDMKVAIGDE